MVLKTILIIILSLIALYFVLTFIVSIIMMNIMMYPTCHNIDEILSYEYKMNSIIILSLRILLLNQNMVTI